MSLDKILSISGKPGLYKIVAQTRTGFVAESLLDKKRVTVNMNSNVSVLSEIAVYTLKEELPLKDVLKKIKDKEQSKPTSISHKDSKEQLEEYFFGVLPDYDEDKVYASDIKKIIQWYNILQQNDLLEVLETEAEEKPAIKKDEVAPKSAPKKAVTKSAAPKASATKKGGATKSASTRKV